MFYGPTHVQCTYVLQQMRTQAPTMLGRSDRTNQRLAWHCNISTLNFDFELGGRGSVQVGRFPRAALLIYNSGVGVEGFQAGPEEAGEVLVVEDVAETG